MVTNRVDPSVAISALHHPALMLSGNASTFALNTLGTEGALYTISGALTNASTNPP